MKSKLDTDEYIFIKVDIFKAINFDLIPPRVDSSNRFQKKKLGSFKIISYVKFVPMISIVIQIIFDEKYPITRYIGRLSFLFFWRKINKRLDTRSTVQRSRSFVPHSLDVKCNKILDFRRKKREKEKTNKNLNEWDIVFSTGQWFGFQPAGPPFRWKRGGSSFRKFVSDDRRATHDRPTQF